MKKVSNKKNISDAKKAVILRNDFYKDSNKKLNIVGISSIIGFFGALFILAFAYNSEPTTSYIATDEDGRVVKPIPLSQPNQSDPVVANWMSTCMIETFDFHFKNYDQQIPKVKSKCYTNNGAIGLDKALQESGILKAIVNKKLISSFSLESTPILIKKGLNRNKYSWKYGLKGKITFRTQTAESTTNVKLTIVVSRESVLKNQKGLGIVKFQLIRT